MSRTRLLLAAVLAAAPLAACGGPAYVRLRGVSPLNVNDASESTPVDVRLYQLKDDGRFTRARVEELWTKDREVLADDLLGQKKVTVFPGREDEAPKDVEIGELHAECRFVGVLALFSRPDDKGPRHLVIPAKEAKGRVLRFLGSHVALEN